MPGAARDVNGPTTTGMDLSLVTGMDLSLVTGMDLSLATGTDLSLVTGTDLSLATGTDPSPATGTDLIPATGTDLIPTAGTDRSRVRVAAGPGRLRDRRALPPITRNASSIVQCTRPRLTCARQSSAPPAG